MTAALCWIRSLMRGFCTGPRGGRLPGSAVPGSPPEHRRRRFRSVSARALRLWRKAEGAEIHSRVLLLRFSKDRGTFAGVTHDGFMSAAVEQARLGLASGEVPIGAVL